MPPAPTASPRAPQGAAPLVVFGVAAAAFVAGLVSWIAAAPFAPGFDDAEHVMAAITWRDELRLAADGIFVRVPLWQVLLGSLFWLSRPGVAILALQVVCVLATLAAGAVALGRRTRGGYVLPLLLVALSPQAIVYARHAVNELFIGALAAWVLVWGTGQWRRAPLAMGLAVGAATMTKLSMGLLAIPAAVFAWRGAAETRGARIAWLAAGAALVVLPMLALHVAQRGDHPLDNTSAYTLGEYMPEEWMALGTPTERQRAGMESFRRQVREDPAGFARGALHRLQRWIARPASADFALFVPKFPKRPVGIWEHVVLVLLLGLAIYGTTRTTAVFWLFVAAIPIACTIPVHVPFVPKILPVFACLPLAVSGWERLMLRID